MLLAASDTALQTTPFIVFSEPVISELAGYLVAILGRKGGFPLGGPMHVDGSYNWYRLAYPHRRTFVAAHELGYQRSSNSEIYQFRGIDQVQVVRQRMAGARRMKNLTEFDWGIQLSPSHAS